MFIFKQNTFSVLGLKESGFYRLLTY